MKPLGIKYQTNFHLGPFKSKDVKEEARVGARAFLFFSRRYLNSPKTTQSAMRTTIQGSGLSLSSYHNGWVHFNVGIQPLSTRRLVTANRILNGFASFINPRIKSKVKISGIFNLTKEYPKTKIRLAKHFVTERIDGISASTGFRLLPSGMWLTARDGKVARSIIVTGYEDRYSVDSVIYTPVGDQIPINALTKNYKDVSEMLRQALPTLQAK